jgi:RHS repeat-associated protein
MSLASTLPGKSATFSYDGDGNEVTKITSQTQNMVYDAADHLVTANAVTGTATYAYDGDGRKISKTIGGVTTQYINDGLGTLVEIQSGKMSAAYFNGANGLVKKRTYSIGTPTVLTDDLFYHQDGLGSTCMLTDGNGRIVEKYQYDPFGQTIGSAGMLNKHTFTGKEEDDDIGLIYFNARWMDAGAGRFTQVDPVVGDPHNSQDWQQYVYVRNDPINGKDPTGKDLSSDLAVAAEEAQSLSEFDAGLTSALLGAASVIVGALEVVQMLTNLRSPQLLQGMTKRL